MNPAHLTALDREAANAAALEFSQALKVRSMVRRTILLAVCTVALGSVALTLRSTLPNPILSPNDSGTLSTYSTSGSIEVTTPFFQNLGTNGRTCNSCHVSSTAWTISPPEV